MSSYIYTRRIGSGWPAKKACVVKVVRPWTGQIHCKGFKCTRSSEGGTTESNRQPEQILKWKLKGNDPERPCTWNRFSDWCAEMIHISGVTTNAGNMPVGTAHVVKESKGRSGTLATRRAYCNKAL